MKDENILYWIWLSEACGSASKSFVNLATRYDDPFEIYRLEEDEIEHLEGVGRILREHLCDKSLEGAYSILRYCKQNKVDIVTYGDPRYPARLRTIEDPPVLLYCLGKFPDMNRRLCIATVGTRTMSEYGQDTAYRIAYELSSAGAVLVSGMALGIDGVCASAAMEAGGTTVAVLGSGISVVYPKEHTRLMESIVRHGAVITEYPPMERPNGDNFPRRNRIISGLCQGTLIVEGAPGSGALITASMAIAQGRELFALPGKVDDRNSKGPNELIQNGAHVALHADDILSFYDFLYHDVINYKGLARAKKQTLSPLRTIKKYGVSSRPLRTAATPPVPTEDKALPAEPKRAVKKKSAEVPVTPEKKNEQASVSADRSQEILVSLDDTTRKVLEAMPCDRPVSPDALAATGLDMGDVMTALTMLELGGFVSSLPGGLYTRK